VAILGFKCELGRWYSTHHAVRSKSEDRRYYDGTSKDPFERLVRDLSCDDVLKVGTSRSQRRGHRGRGRRHARGPAQMQDRS